MNTAQEVHRIASTYLYKVKKSGPDHIMALCPFHDNRNTPSFTMSLSQGLYYCFSCHEAGNLRMFLRAMGVGPANIDRQYKDVIEETRRNAPRQSDDPFVRLRGTTTSRCRRLFSGCSTRSSQTSGRSRRGWTSTWSRSSTSAST